MPGLGTRHLSQEECEQIAILGRAASSAELIIGMCYEAGDAAAALVTEMHRHAVRAEKIVKSDTLSDDELQCYHSSLYKPCGSGGSCQQRKWQHLPVG